MSRTLPAHPTVTGPRLLVDSHVHFHRDYSASTFLATAWLHLRAAARRRGFDQHWHGLLVITDGFGQDGFDRLIRQAPAAGWTVTPAHPRVCELSAETAHGRQRLSLIGGRQIVTHEDLEVLAIAGGEVGGGWPLAGLDEGRSLADTLLAVQDTGALAVLPWGFGKWWGGRGRTIEGLLRQLPPTLDRARFFLGDNGGRPRLGRAPEPFLLARALGLRILAGSDPLPWRAQQQRAGSYGSWLDPAPRRDSSAEPDAAARLITGLADPASRLHPFGRRRGLVGFVADQLAMQWRKRIAQRVGVGVGR